MKSNKRKKLESAGWRVGSPAELLDLRPEEETLIELKLAFSEHLKSRRLLMNITQAELAKRLRSSQSRVAKMEAADESVSLDLLVRGLAVLGATRVEIGEIAGATN